MRQQKNDAACRYASGVIEHDLCTVIPGLYPARSDPLEKNGVTLLTHEMKTKMNVTILASQTLAVFRVYVEFHDVVAGKALSDGAGVNQGVSSSPIRTGGMV